MTRLWADERPARLSCPAIAIVLGVLLQIATWTLAVDEVPVGFRLAAGVWGAAPYGLLAFIATRPDRRPAVACVPAWLVLLADAYNFRAVFMVPDSSTAGLSLLVAPVWNLILLIPCGMLAGWALAKGASAWRP